MHVPAILLCLEAAERRDALRGLSDISATHAAIAPCFSKEGANVYKQTTNAFKRIIDPEATARETAAEIRKRRLERAAESKRARESGAAG